MNRYVPSRNEVGGELKEWNLELRDVKSVSPRAINECCLVPFFYTAHQKATEEGILISMQSSKEGNS